jgi:hypothetical protein
VQVFEQIANLEAIKLLQARAGGAAGDYFTREAKTLSNLAG